MPYLDGVVDRVREVLDGADGRFLLRRILRRGIRLGDMWDNDLNVAFRSEGPRLEKRLQVEYTALVHVLTRLHVVQRIRNAVDACEEVRIVDV